MNIALIGYGKMGRAIETIALSKGHRIAADIAVEFTTPETAVDNYYRCFAAGKPVVSGTTGWLSRLAEVKARCIEGNQTMFYASNFSVGVNILFALNRYLAQIMKGYPMYDIRIKEVHHVHKKDAPSGTALTIAEEIRRAIKLDVEIESVREGEEPGFHEVICESDVDVIRISHGAKGREGFAAGVVAAAEFTIGQTGFIGMENMLSFSIH